MLGTGFAAPEARSPELPAPELRAAPTCRPASVAVGSPTSGLLRHGVRLQAAGREFFTWDPVLHRRPNRAWRRVGTDAVVAVVLRIATEYALTHPTAPRLGIGDLSRPRGGPFGPKHVSHQNGLDVDVYYPRRDRLERPPLVAGQVDRRLAQDLVDRFVRAGAETIYVGPNVFLRGPRGIVETLWNHDNHLHARFPSGFSPPGAGNATGERGFTCSKPTSSKS